MKLTGLTASLVTNDPARSTAFYRDVLGFAVQRTVPDEAPHVFVWLERDGVNIFLNAEAAVRDDAPDASSIVVGKSGVTMFLGIEGVAGLWEQVRERATVIMPLKDQWYGMTEFAIADPDGYVITFAERRA
jgi:uncharacterized glyoxalase superfamily protein PhnB